MAERGMFVAKGMKVMQKRLKKKACVCVLCGFGDGIREMVCLACYYFS